MTSMPISSGSIVAASLIAASLLAAAPAIAQQKAKPAQAGIDGTWGGTVQQLGGLSKPYAMTMTLTKDGGVTDYPELKCQGKLTRIGTSGGYTFYTETITKGGLSQGGQCINGSIAVLPTAGKLAWGWLGTDAGAAIVAGSTLARR